MMDAKTLASLPPKLLAQYLRDPQAMMAQQMMQEGSDTSPVQHWAQGLARIGKGIIGGLEGADIRNQYAKQGQDVANERQLAMALMQGRPAERQTTDGETTIDWNAQAPNYGAAIAGLNSPDNQDLQDRLLAAKMSSEHEARSQAFAQAQQDRSFQQQSKLQNDMLNRQIGLEQYKSDHDPKAAMFNSIFGGGQQAQPMQQPQQGTANIQAPPTPDQLDGIRIDAMPQQAVAPVQQQGMAAPAGAFDPRITSMAMTSGIKMPDGQGLDSNGRFVPIGMQAKAIPAEVTARMALGDTYLKDAPAIQQGLQELDSGGMLNRIKNRAEMAAGVGKPGELVLHVQSGVDSLLRGLTGAGMPASEAEKYVARYQPTATDSQDRLMYKYNQLTKEIQNTGNAVRKQYGQPEVSYPAQTQTTATDGAGWTSTPNGAKYRVVQ